VSVGVNLWVQTWTGGGRGEGGKENTPLKLVGDEWLRAGMCCLFPKPMVT